MPDIPNFLHSRENQVKLALAGIILILMAISVVIGFNNELESDKVEAAEELEEAVELGIMIFSESSHPSPASPPILGQRMCGERLKKVLKRTCEKYANSVELHRNCGSDQNGKKCF